MPFSGKLSRFVPVGAFSGDDRVLLMLDLEERTVAWQGAPMQSVSLIKGERRSYVLDDKQWVAAFDDRTGKLVAAAPTFLVTQLAQGSLWVLDRKAHWRVLDDQTLQPLDGGPLLPDLTAVVRGSLGLP